MTLRVSPWELGTQGQKKDMNSVHTATENLPGRRHGHGFISFGYEKRELGRTSWDPNLPRQAVCLPIVCENRVDRLPPNTNPHFERHDSIHFTFPLCGKCTAVRPHLTRTGRGGRWQAAGGAPSPRRRNRILAWSRGVTARSALRDRDAPPGISQRPPDRDQARRMSSSEKAMSDC